MENAVKFLRDILQEIKTQDPLHAKTLKHPISESKDYDRLRNHIYSYFKRSGINAKTVAGDYLHMVGDMRREAGYFMLYDKYSCKNQQEAFKKVYSRPEVMRYYMNALLISQLLWIHHFNMLQYFKKTLSISNKCDDYKVLDVGAGYALFSWIVKSKRPDFGKITILDVSDDSLEMAAKMLGRKQITYLNYGLFFLGHELEYDLIILGEILEHLDDPLATLRKAVSHLSERGMIFLTVPINAPAIDHVYLFRDRLAVLKMIKSAGLQWVSAHTEIVDNQTQLIGAFCIKNEIFRDRNRAECQTY